MKNRKLPVSRSLEIEFIVTEHCNLGCTYCYMNNVKNSVTINDAELFLNGINKILKEYKADTYNIGFFGGEPLIKFNELIEISKIIRKNDPRNISQTIITNGTLLDEEKLKIIKENGLGLSISFDGIWQDENRPLISGDSCLKLFESKKELILGCISGTKVMIGPNNVSSMVENLEYLVNFGFTFPDFTLVRDDIWSNEDINNYKKEITRLTDRIIKYFKDGKIVVPGLHSLWMLDILASKKFGKRPWGCFAGCTGIGYLPGGEFYPCARFASERRYLLLKDNTIYHENIADLLQPHKTDPSKFEECISCPLIKICNGGCTYSFLKNGDWERSKPIENLCKLYKITFLEINRLKEELNNNELWQHYYNKHILGRFN